MAARQLDLYHQTTTQRGYGPQHQKLRAQWAVKVARGTIPCARCGYVIMRGQAWDLGHDDYDRTRYTGPEHAACNRAAGGRLARARTAARKRAMRRW